MNAKKFKELLKGLPKAKKTKGPSARHLATIRRVMESGADGDTKIKHLYLGRAGESFVASHLLRRGLNPASLPVDAGVDLLAHSLFKTDRPLLHAEHELFQFQIKTTANEYKTTLRVEKVHELWHKAINLVVVFWANEKSPSAVVLPPSLIYMLTSGGFEDPRAPLNMIGDRVSLRFIERDGRYFIRNYDHEITAMLNRFDRAEPIGTNTNSFPPYAYWADGPALVAFDLDEQEDDQVPTVKGTDETATDTRAN